MTSDPSIAPERDASPSSLVRAAIWVAIGALIAAAIVCVIWVLIGSQNGIVGRAFLTILLLAAFAGVAILDAHLAPRRPAWFALASMASWVVALLVGAVLIWLPSDDSWFGYPRFLAFLLVVLILQLALLHVRLYSKAFQRYVTGFTQAVFIVTVSLVVALVALLVVPLVLAEFVDFADIYWRIVVAVTILAAVGTALIPLVNALFAPKKVRPAPPVGPPVHAGAPAPGSEARALAAPPSAPTAPDPGEPLPWPTFTDGVTPLPMMPDGNPDWGAYYTGYPSEGAYVYALPPGSPAAQQAAASAATAPAEPPAPPASIEPPVPPASTPGYEGYPPPPPLPPRS
ncbi:hypothetical protein GCM10022200_28520 [Microbacterium awajiense]|uniref:Uncharacterized protein n=1 Tax=Microbacterium awajiense TaxID=415214 RepID=A0ABP7AXL8_9MICO